MNFAHQRGNIPALTGLRGVAAVWVILYHLTIGIPIVQNGYLGVDVFFMLSGYVLTYVYAAKLTNGGDYLGFLRARLARIYPLHLTVLCVLALMVVALPGFAERYPMPEERWGFGPFLASLFLVQNWAHFLPSSWNTPTWSLSAEWLAYLFFPLFLFATQWPRSAIVPLLLAGGSLFALYAAFTLKDIPSVEGLGMPGLARMVCEFTAGCLLYRAVANGLRRLPALAEMVALALVLIAAISGGELSFLALPAFALIVLLSVQESATARFLSTAPIVFLGEISYSIYLTHWILIQGSQWLLAGRLAEASLAIWKIGLVLICIGISTLTYRWIECPARAWGRSRTAQAKKTLAPIAG